MPGALSCLRGSGVEQVLSASHGSDAAPCATLPRDTKKAGAGRVSSGDPGPQRKEGRTMKVRDLQPEAVVPCLRS